MADESTPAAFPHPDAPDLPTAPPRGTVKSGVRLSFRTNPNGLTVHAFFATDDGAECHEVGVMSKAWLKEHPPLWEAWRKALNEAMNAVVEKSLGLPAGTAVTVAEEPADRPETIGGNPVTSTTGYARQAGRVSRDTPPP